jgi:hypothetical protein
MNKQLKVMKLNLLAGNNPTVSRDLRMEQRLSARVSCLQSLREEELAPKPIRGLENIIYRQKYIQIFAVDENISLYIGEILDHSLFFSPLETDPNFHYVYFDGVEDTLEDNFVVGDVMYGYTRLFAYSSRNLEILTDLVSRKAFDEYYALIDPYIPIHAVWAE